MAVEWETAAITSCRTEWVAVGYAPCCQEVLHIVNETFGICSEPKSEAGRHGYLKMGIARHEHVFMTVGLGDEFVE